jgi:hypothetical protein
MLSEAGGTLIAANDLRFHDMPAALLSGRSGGARSIHRGKLNRAILTRRLKVLPPHVDIQIN